MQIINSPPDLRLLKQLPLNVRIMTDLWDDSYEYTDSELLDEILCKTSGQDSTNVSYKNKQHICSHSSQLENRFKKKQKTLCGSFLSWLQSE